MAILGRYDQQYSFRFLNYVEALISIAINRFLQLK